MAPHWPPTAISYVTIRYYLYVRDSAHAGPTELPGRGDLGASALEQECRDMEPPGRQVTIDGDRPFRL